MAGQTRRWFADNSVSYALAAIALAEYARDHRQDEDRIMFGPLDPAGMRGSGLVVSGSKRALDQVAAVLAAIPGVAAERNGQEEAAIPIT